MTNFITFDSNDDYTLITILIDTIDLVQAPKLSKEIISVLEAMEYPDVLIDLNNISYINSAGLGSLVGIHNLMRKHNKKIIFLSNNEKTKKIIQITGVDKILRICKDEEEARKNL